MKLLCELGLYEDGVALALEVDTGLAKAVANRWGGGGGPMDGKLCLGGCWWNGGGARTAGCGWSIGSACAVSCCCNSGSALAAPTRRVAAVADGE